MTPDERWLPTSCLEERSREMQGERILLEWIDEVEL